jgi:hypothetical protein
LAALDAWCPVPASATDRVILEPRTLALPGAAPLAVFCKHYVYRRPAWKFVARRSKARCEYDNYAVFARLGIACAQRIACGESRDGLGRLRRAFILTRAIPDALTLPEFLARHCPTRHTAAAREIRQALRRQLADMTRRAHRAGFFHHDLVWRNVLVTWQPPAPPRLWWIDCPRGRFDRWSPWRRRRQWKDLASLDKSAARLCSRGERLAFVQEYLGKKRLDPASRRLVRRTLAYRKVRWPEDWRGP